MTRTVVTGALAALAVVTGCEKDPPARPAPPPAAAARDAAMPA
ncbi:MAG: hypothetical protein JWM10_2843, partial [Myxococcaceae bacterium]|nr:hypothetical protein [Myxococcaceae bacterium]